MARGPLDTSYDVIVVGGGGAGLAAAIEACTAGKRVVLLEKNAALGGSTAWSIGSITATGTPHQRKHGIEDNPRDHWTDMTLFAEGPLAARDNDELRRILCNEVPDAFRWLMTLGVRFYGPMPEPPHRKPRMHNVLPNSRSYIYHLERHARRIGVDIRTNSRVSDLVTDSARVVGVVSIDAQGFSRRFDSRGGVILAAGDFTNGADLKAHYMGPREAKVEAVNATATGDGQKLALKLGARILNGDLALGPEIRFIPPARATLVHRLPPWQFLANFMHWALDHLPQAILRPFMMAFLTTALAPAPSLFEHGALLVNKAGRRFCDERRQPAYALADQPDKIGYILIDQRIARLFSAWPHFVSTAPGVAYAYISDYRRNRRDIYKTAPTLAALGQAFGIDGTRLETTVGERNTGLAKSGANITGRLLPLNDPPFVALGPVRAVFVHNEGGLAVDDRHRVLDGADKPILGLYAAGSTGQGGLLLKGHGHHLAWAFVSGRRAGRIAAETVQNGATVA
jgi:fumarate reductase flavoprotein subunit